MEIARSVLDVSAGIRPLHDTRQITIETPDKRFVPGLRKTWWRKYANSDGFDWPMEYERQLADTRGNIEQSLMVTFHKVKLNPQLSDETFTYRPPPGSLMIEPARPPCRFGYKDPDAQPGMDENDTRASDAQLKETEKNSLRKKTAKVQRRMPGSFHHLQKRDKSHSPLTNGLYRLDREEKPLDPVDRRQTICGPIDLICSCDQSCFSWFSSNH